MKLEGELVGLVKFVIVIRVLLDIGLVAIKLIIFPLFEHIKSVIVEQFRFNENYGGNIITNFPEAGIRVVGVKFNVKEEVA
jgi:hypothetical protein